jgi:hypothetical protein
MGQKASVFLSVVAYIVAYYLQVMVRANPKLGAPFWLGTRVD